MLGGECKKYRHAIVLKEEIYHASMLRNMHALEIGRAPRNSRRLCSQPQAKAVVQYGRLWCNCFNRERPKMLRSKNITQTMKRAPS